MADLDTGPHSAADRHRKRRGRTFSTRMDMTPMVDLAFLLLTFFVLTSVFSKRVSLDLVMPVKGEATRVKNILTLVLDKSDSIHYYFGELKSGASKPFGCTDYSARGIRKLLIASNGNEYKDVVELERKILAGHSTDERTKEKELKEGTSRILGRKNALTVVIKTCDGAKYGRVINIMDELNIARIQRRALVDLTPEEKELIRGSGW